jgi:hypothetical protein
VFGPQGVDEDAETAHNPGAQMFNSMPPSISSEMCIRNLGI